MFKVLVHVYENYWRGDACPELPMLGRRLKAVGFESDDIEAALIWLDGLNTATQRTQIYLPLPEGTTAPKPFGGSMDVPTPKSMRVYSTAEQHHLGSMALGYISFLESSGALAPAMGEIVIDRAMAAPGSPVDVDDLKIIILMVYWSFGQQPDALVLDELCDNADGRVGH